MPLTLVPKLKFQSSSHRMHWNGHFRQIFYGNFHWSAELTLRIHKLKFRRNVIVSLTGSRGPKQNTGQISWDNSITLILFSDLTFCAKQNVLPMINSYYAQNCYMSVFLKFAFLESTYQCLSKKAHRIIYLYDRFIIQNKYKTKIYILEGPSTKGSLFMCILRDFMWDPSDLTVQVIGLYT